MNLFKACFIEASNVNPADLDGPPRETPAFNGGRARVILPVEPRSNLAGLT